jgi:uncharacterized protein YjbI with pentapeptide repeats
MQEPRTAIYHARAWPCAVVLARRHTKKFPLDPRRATDRPWQKTSEHGPIGRVVGTPISEELREFREGGTTLRNRQIVGEPLAGADLAGLRADGLTLRDVDLRGSTLRNVEWLNCTLCDVRMSGSDGRDAIVRMCNFQRVHAAECDLSGAKLEDCEAQGIVLDGATLKGGSLMETDLTRASLRGADLRGADLRGANLDGADLDGADVRGALLDGEDEAEPEPVQEPFDMAGLPPGLPIDELMVAVSPVVLELLQRGNRRGVLDDATLARMLDEMKPMGGQPVQLDGALLQILERASKVGVGPLLSAMRTGGDTPPPEIANLILGLMDDAKLGPDANAEDLVVHLFQQLQTAVSPESD